MKAHFTRKEVIKNSSIVLLFSYNEISELMFGHPPFGFNGGVYGWNCDYYMMGGIVFCTGYRPHGYRFKEVNEITDKYNTIVKPIYYNSNISYAEKLATIANNRNCWYEEIKAFLYGGQNDNN